MEVVKCVNRDAVSLSKQSKSKRKAQETRSKSLTILPYERA